ncbi:MAG: spore coat protein CotJB [Defluviitaleaceae bacterium]|nr:spore coat protein CotJB [Defluviitaleaceae bacterium]MCL2238554.1 spore coat protein CotJB [Defluviitaleaceae bacterium]
MNRDTLLHKITALDFMAVDLQLFLNTNPHNREALEIYNDTVAKATAARRQYEAQFGPLTGARDPSGPGWPWMDEPWPWQNERSAS